MLKRVSARANLVVPSIGVAMCTALGCATGAPASGPTLAPPESFSRPSSSDGLGHDAPAAPLPISVQTRPCRSPSPSPSPSFVARTRGSSGSRVEAHWSAGGHFLVERVTTTSRGRNPYNVREVEADNIVVFRATEGRASGPLSCCTGRGCPESAISGIAVSPDERFIIVAGQGLCSIDLRDSTVSQREPRTTGAAAAGAGDVAFGAAGKVLVEIAAPAVRIFDVLPSGELRASDARSLPRMHLTAGAHLAFHPGGWEIAVGGGITGASSGALGHPQASREPIYVWSIDDGSSVAVLDEHVAPISRLLYSPEGGQLASLDVNGDLLLWNARKPPGVRVASGVSSFAFVDEETLVLGMRDGRTLVRRDAGVAPTDLPELSSAVLNIAVHAGRGLVAVQDEAGRLLVWSPNAKTCGAASLDPGVPGGLTFSADGSAVGVARGGEPPVWVDTAPH